MRPYPLKFKPIYKPRIWGGQKLRLLGKNIPPDERIGESWEIADLSQDKSIIANGSFAGLTLADAIQKYPQQIMGDKNFSGPFPLLIKFLDTEDILSIQVHPDAQTCKTLGKGQPKTECWYVISATPDAVIYRGLKDGVTRENLKVAIEQGSAADLLQKIRVKAGQCYLLPAGTPHSIGPGLLIAEIQTPSDTTYRIFDFNRVDPSGRRRELHIQEALKSIQFKRTHDNPPATTKTKLVDCEHFKIDKSYQKTNTKLILPAGKMKIIIFLSGSGRMYRATETIELCPGDCLVIPAAYEGRAEFSKDSEYLTVTT